MTFTESVQFFSLNNLLKLSKFLVSNLIVITSREQEYRQAAPVNLIRLAMCLENYVVTHVYVKKVKIIAFSFSLTDIYMIRGSEFS